MTPPNTEITPSRHTPGEWYFDHDSDGDFAIFGGETGNKLLAVTNSDTPEDEANAYLFAAAPDMLSALKLLEPYLSTREDALNHAACTEENRCSGFDVASLRAREAIQKAEKQP